MYTFFFEVLCCASMLCYAVQCVCVCVCVRACVGVCVCVSVGVYVCVIMLQTVVLFYFVVL